MFAVKPNLEIVYGQTRQPGVAHQLAEAVRISQATGTLYVGYPVLASTSEPVNVDALLVSREHGVVAFSLASVSPRTEDAKAWARLADEQDRLYYMVKNHLERRENLRRGRELAVPIEAVTVFPSSPELPDSLQGRYWALGEVAHRIHELGSMDVALFEPLEAAVQRVTTIKPAKRRAEVKQTHSRGAVLKQMEQAIANLDQWQKHAAIETPEGPQRIRGLAGSGKTVVLALKAAYLHTAYPDWTIAVTFYTRSLYQQLQDLIERFTFEHINDKPDWSRLRLLHAWGGRDRDGMYTDMAAALDHPARDFLYARNVYGMQGAFEGVCTELLAVAGNREITPLYNAVLIDEAQDLPPAFLQLAYRFTCPPKRIVWAYDELQKLSETTMPSLAELFGSDANGHPLVHLVNRDGQPKEDVILPICYRNTHWALTLAHALGLGIYRGEGLLQHFDEPLLWTEIGYQVVDGTLQPGQRVVLQRSPQSRPKYFEDLLVPDDAVTVQKFSTEQEQDAWVASSIRQNLQQDELEPSDILIVLPNAWTAKSRSAALARALASHGIAAHLAGVQTHQDRLFQDNSVAIANIYRAKGNEAGIVYVLDCQYVAFGLDLITRRNILFTAITRSRAWVRLCGHGPNIDSVMTEAAAVKQRGYRLEFRLPTPEQSAAMRQIHRERTDEERARAEKAAQGLATFVDGLQRGDISLEHLPVELRTRLAKMMKTHGQIGDEGE